MKHMFVSMCCQAFKEIFCPSHMPKKKKNLIIRQCPLDDLPAHLLTDPEANQSLQTVWSHQPFSRPFVLTRREPVLHFTGTECSVSAPSPRQPQTPSSPLTPAMGWWEPCRKGVILQCDNVGPEACRDRKLRERKEIICA